MIFVGTVLECIAHLSKLKEGLYEIHEHKQKRTLNQNSFYWQIVGMIAKALREPNIYVHNLLLRRLEIYEIIDDFEVLILLPNTDRAEKQSFYNEELHVKPIRGEQGIQGKFRWYKVLKGSRNFTTEEMNRLVEMALNELRDMGLQLPQEERFIKALEEHERIKANGNLETS